MLRQYTHRLHIICISVHDTSYVCTITQNAVEGIPNLSLPDVCTNAAVHRMAFCQQHCDLLTSTNPNIPTDLRGFLRYCTKGEVLYSIIRAA